MPTWFLWTFLVLVVVAIAARAALPALPVRRLATPVTPPDIVLIVIGYLGLAFHCGSMFFGATTRAIPFTDSATRIINALGTASIVWFAIPCALILIGVRRLPLPLLALMIAALTAVGITMYDGGSLEAHLGAIFAAVVVLTLVPIIALSPRRALRVSVRPSTA